MKKTSNTIPRVSHSIGKYDIVIENELIKCRIYWARIIGSETESLFTKYTKHTFFEIQYALEGKIVMQIENNQKITIEPDNFITIPPDTFHQIVDGDTVGARFIMAFSLEIKKASLSKVPEELSLLVPHQETSYMQRLLEIIAGKSYNDTPLRRKLIAGYLECLVLEIIEAVCPFNTENDDSIKSVNESRVMQIERYIANYSGIGIRPSDIAVKFNISERHLNRIYVSVTGKTLKEAINRQKLAKIEELVAATTLSFREISELCGFSDEYSMNKFFKRYNHYGLSEYRALRSSK